ncbi:MAG: hypothetical protein ACKVX7_16970 [Planctomycetota bacterium]
MTDSRESSKQGQKTSCERSFQKEISKELATSEEVLMGARSRAGSPAMCIGNTAERLLPVLNCSVIAIKPEGDINIF